MKIRLYKAIFTLFAIGIGSSISAQKFEKKFTENFKVNKDVEVVINATNTDINVSNWNKNEVSIEAFIEIEGVSKTEAETYFKDWNFEALGNKAKVKITAKGNNSFNFDGDFVFFNNNDFKFPEIVIPDFDSIHFDFPTMADIVIPEIDFDEILPDIQDFDHHIGENGNYSFSWNDGDHNIIIKSKKEWEAFKQTKEYQELKNKMKIDKRKLKIEFEKSKEKMKSIDKKKIEAELRKAKIEFQKIDRVQIKKQLAEARKNLEEVRMNFISDRKSREMTIDGKKVKIKKRLEIKVPKNTTFNLNTRYCKIKLPNIVASGNVKYGSFDANNLIGGKLTVDYSPVNINDLNACTLFLNNVTDAKIASVTNSKMTNNSSGVHINRIHENVDLKNKFGELSILNITPNYQSFKLFLDYTDAQINVSNISKNLLYTIGDKSRQFPNKASMSFNIFDATSKDINGNFRIKTKDNSFFIQGKYSQLSIKK